MDIYEFLLIGLSLSMDAFAISVTNGAAYGGAKKQAFITALAFGLAQGLMPLIGYLLGSGFSHIIASFDHWVAFALLLLIGGKMLRDGLRDLRSKVVQRHISWICALCSVRQSQPVSMRLRSVSVLRHCASISSIPPRSSLLRLFSVAWPEG